MKNVFYCWFIRSWFSINVWITSWRSLKLHQTQIILSLLKHILNVNSIWSCAINISIWADNDQSIDNFFEIFCRQIGNLPKIITLDLWIYIIFCLKALCTTESTIMTKIIDKFHKDILWIGISRTVQYLKFTC